MKNLLFIIAFVSFVSCNSKWDKTALVGNWNTVEWIKIDTGEKLNNTMQFMFGSDDRYSVDYGTEKEHGKYWIGGEYLHTVEDGRAEKKVLITKLNTDTLEFEMNRGGYLEKLTLIKV